MKKKRAAQQGVGIGQFPVDPIPSAYTPNPSIGPSKE